MAKLIFINLPVSDLARATVFYQAIGAVKNRSFQTIRHHAWYFPIPSMRC
jgi:predicted lactoylglutathione lyase